MITEDDFKDKDLYKIFDKIDDIVWFIQHRSEFWFFNGVLNTILLALLTMATLVGQGDAKASH